MVVVIDRKVNVLLMIAITSWPESREKSHACNLIGSPESWTVESANTRKCSKCARPFYTLGGGV